MSGFVTVRLRADSGVAAGVPLPLAGPDVPVRPLREPSAPSLSEPTLCVRVRSGGRLLVLHARPGRQDVQVPALDEHFVVDADLDADLDGESRWLACADVVTASRPRAVREARRLLADMVARCPGAAIAAVPLVGGGWVATGAQDHRVVALGRAMAVHPLFPSCLHAWLVAGGTLAELAVADLVVTRCPAYRVTPPARRTRDRPAARRGGSAGGARREGR